MASIECNNIHRFTDGGVIACKCGVADVKDCPAKTKKQITKQCFQVNLIGSRRGQRPGTKKAPVAPGSK
jgi:hypothetical protein